MPHHNLSLHLWHWLANGFIGIAGMMHSYNREAGRPDPDQETKNRVKDAIQTLVNIFGPDILPH